ncbi:Uncharacterised protein [Streptococcus constellatus]|uniref:Uncharacterized protein n=1 Tax=Streptococcus constellatus TaxID=76860 RepID=A0A564S6N7_STRCV|nr:Uncharacterised protein [Streptococcus constellatus]VUW93579.1 Uncharacterised protein [Streptococcus gordonii]
MLVLDERSLLQNIEAYLSMGKKGTVAIYGHGASGKSTFAKRLVESLGESELICWWLILI